MSADANVTPLRSYGCSFGCGNPYDVVVVFVNDGTSQFLCIPCFVRTAHDMIAAITTPDDPDVAARLNGDVAPSQAPMAWSKVEVRGKNAPADVDDPDVIEAFQSVITEDELPDEFR